MKYVVVLGDGMADLPVESLGGRTPLEVAEKPYMDALCTQGELGMVHTVPPGMPPASDVANLSVMGYDPRVYYSGRSPLEAVSIGVDLQHDDVTFRCNLVTLSEGEAYPLKTMIDYSSDEIPTEESRVLMAAVQERFGRKNLHFFPGRSYRHLMVWNEGRNGFTLTPPHDISGRAITSYLPQGEQSEWFRDMMEQSFGVLDDHPVNRKRRAAGLRPANSIWLWGEGRKPSLPDFSSRYGVSGAVISAVDLIKGIGLCAGLDSIEVEGATGTIHSNLTGKGLAVIEQLEAGKEFVYVHIEAPDESGHRNELDNKILAIERIDREILGPVYRWLQQSGEPFALMVLPDHPTPMLYNTHTSDPVPYVIYRSWQPLDFPGRVYTELCAHQTGIVVEQGHTLMDRFLKTR